jgi:UDP-glucose:(glucosyl)LPS alpha-1,2-glucosyltransferase
MRLVNQKSYGGSEILIDYYLKYVKKEFQDKVNLSANVPSISNKIDITWVFNSYNWITAKEIYETGDKVDQIVFISEWQRRMYLMHNPNLEKNSVAIHAGVEPIDSVKKTNQHINLVYFSTPDRGLDILVSAFNMLQEENVYLHIFSSFEIYAQKERDNEYYDIINFCKNHPKIVYHGSVPHNEMRDALKEMHIMTYPSTFEETFCMSAAEAMSAECQVVCSDLGALPETTAGFSSMYRYHENKFIHTHLFLETLKQELQVYRKRDFSKQKLFVDENYSWYNKIKDNWNCLIQKL